MGTSTPFQLLWELELPLVALLRLDHVERAYPRPKLNPLDLRKWHFTFYLCCVLLFSFSVSSHWYSFERHSRANVTQRTYLLWCQWKSQVPPKVNVCNVTFVVLPIHSATWLIILYWLWEGAVVTRCTGTFGIAFLAVQNSDVVVISSSHTNSCRHQVARNGN